MPIERLTHANHSWMNIEKPTPDDMHYLAEHYPFHPLDLEDCLSSIERPKIDEYEDYLFIVVHFPVYDRETQMSRSSEIDFFIGGDYLVSVHDGILTPIYKLFDDCQREEETRRQYMGTNPGRLLYAILDRLIDYCFVILNRVGKRIWRIEEEMFSRDMRWIVQEISFVRRDIIALRRIVKPQIPIPTNLELKDRPFIQEELDVYFGDIADGLGRIWDVLEDYRETIEGLSETSDSVTSYRINEVMRILTVISVIMLPLSLISSIYGMNVGLPLDRYPWAFGPIIAVMLLIAGGMLYLFRKRGWL